jgi:hypothetical protein
LRWWSEIKDDGSEEWIFESLDISNSFTFKYYLILENTNAADNKIFWITSYGQPIVWVILGIVSVLSFKVQNVTICILAFILGLTNLLGYIKCEKNHKSKVKGYLYD